MAIEQIKIEIVVSPTAQPSQLLPDVTPDKLTIFVPGRGWQRLGDPDFSGVTMGEGRIIIKPRLDIPSGVSPVEL